MKRFGWVETAFFFCAVAILFVVMQRTAFAAPMFPDVPDMWAADAVRALAAKGLVEGYPDGTFKGDRAATRYEVAMVVARLLAKEEQEHSLFASKADFEELMSLAHQLMEELDAYGIRVQNLESEYAVLDKRVTELERITFYGSLRTIGLTQNIAGGGAPAAGTVTNAGIDYTNGRLLFTGTGDTSRLLMGMHVKLNSDMDAGLEVVGYSAIGSTVVNQYWGVTPPYMSNPFLAQLTFPAANGLTSISGFQQADDHAPFTKMMLDRFWLQDRANGYQLIIGTWQAQNIGDQVLLGVRNPNFNAPAILPFFGFQVTPLDVKDPFQYEFGYSELPTGTFYRGQLGTASSTYNWNGGSFGVSLLKMGQDATTDGQPLSSGFTPLPSSNGQQLEWRDPRSGLLTSVVGPQNEFIWGANLKTDIIDKYLTFHANFGSSRYNPDMTSTLLSTIVNGSMYDVGLSGTIGQFKPEVEYLHVDPTYDTIMLPYAINPNLPVFLPYGNWYTSDYQLHDYLKYPINREGFRFVLNWANDDTSAYGIVESLQQVRATTISQITTPGNAEALFPILLTPGDTAVGTTTTYGIGMAHTFENKLKLTASWYDYDLRRGGSLIDNVNYTENFYRMALGYPIAADFEASLNYAFVDYSGHIGALSKTFEQSIPGVTLTWQMAKNATVNLNGRLFNYIDRTVPINNWRGNQVGVDVNLDF